MSLSDFWDHLRTREGSFKFIRSQCILLVISICIHMIINLFFSKIHDQLVFQYKIMWGFKYCYIIHDTKQKIQNVLLRTLVYKSIPTVVFVLASGITSLAYPVYHKSYIMCVS